MRRKHLLASIIDFTIILLIGQLLILINQTHINYFTNVIFSLIISLIICKDNMNGQSIGKHLMRIQIIDLKTNDAAFKIKTVIRNVFLCLWPIEVIFFLIKSNRRLGDYLSNTKIIEVCESQSIKLSLNDLKALLICFIIILALSSLGMIFSAMNFPLVSLMFQ